MSSLRRQATAQLVTEIKQERQPQGRLMLGCAVRVQHHCDALSIRRQRVRLKRTARDVEQDFLLRPQSRNTRRKRMVLNGVVDHPDAAVRTEEEQLAPVR